MKTPDLTSPERLSDAVREAESFTVFLSDLFEAISAREELKGPPFDRREAALALKLYLGDCRRIVASRAKRTPSDRPHRLNT